MSDNQDPRAAMGKLIERAWRDPVFKRRLVADPETVFTEAGFPVPPGTKIEVVEDSATVSHFILPIPPGEAGLTDAELDAVAAASGTLCQSGTPTISSYNATCR
jgi:hypothetical protein